ncbi:MAG TPA: PepSY domain-containing protein [Stellaceae bacterium]|nr:PepSY domain-containing protein [Stellaceae bacterium]
MQTPKSAIPVALATLLLASAPIALATSARAAAEHEATVEHENKVELQTFQQAKVTLADAVSAAEKHSGGKALGANFEDRNGNPVFRVKTLQNGTVWEGAVDAVSGQIVGQGKTTPESRLDQEDKAEIAAFQKTKTPLTEAVKTAEQHAGGKALDAELEASGGKAVYEMEVVKNGTIQRVTIDPANGQVVAARPSAGSSTPQK